MGGRRYGPGPGSTSFLQCKIWGSAGAAYLSVRCPLRRVMNRGSAIILFLFLFILLAYKAFPQGTAGDKQAKAAGAQVIAQSPAQQKKVFPYPIITQTLPNGLRVTV